MDPKEYDHLRKFVAPEFVFGIGARELAVQYATNLGMRKILVVSDPGVVKAGWTEDVTRGLDGAGIPYTRFNDVTPNPKDCEVMAGAEIYRNEQCNGIIVVGGGSPMDCAKGIGIVSSNGGHILDYEGVDEVPQPCPPLICIPTTAGTSADVSQFCIINDTELMIKIAIVSKAVVPDVSLIDPQTTSTMDRHLTAATGLDALSHAAEAVASNANSPITDVHALAAAKLISMHLLRAIEHPDHMEYRNGMMLASCQAGLAFSNASLGAIHAMAHGLGGLKDLPHGECNAILLPHVMEFNFEAAREPYEKLGEAMGVVFGGSDAEVRKNAVIQKVVELKRAAGVEMTLGQLGLTPQEIPNLARNALKDSCMVTNPRIASQGDIEEIFEHAL